MSMPRRLASLIGIGIGLTTFGLAALAGAGPLEHVVLPATQPGALSPALISGVGGGVPSVVPCTMSSKR